MLDDDIQHNAWVQDHEEMKAKLGPFRPEAQAVFDVPYIPVPEQDMRYAYQAKGMSEALASQVSYLDPSGRRMVRVFFHPLCATTDILDTSAHGHS